MRIRIFLETFQTYPTLTHHCECVLRKLRAKIAKDQSTMWPPMQDLGIRGLNMNFPEAKISVLPLPVRMEEWMDLKCLAPSE